MIYSVGNRDLWQFYVTLAVAVLGFGVFLPSVSDLFLVLKTLFRSYIFRHLFVESFSLSVLPHVLISFSQVFRLNCLCHLIFIKNLVDFNGIRYCSGCPGELTD